MALIIATLVVSLAAMAIWEERIRYRERVEVATQNVSHMLDLHLSSVFDNLEVVAPSNRHDAIHLAGHTCVMHHADGFGSGSNRGLDQRFIDIQRIRADINEDWAPSHADKGRGG